MVLLFIIQLAFSAFYILYWIGFQDVVHYQLDYISQELNLLIVLMNINLFFILIELINTLIFLIFKIPFKKLILTFIVLRLIMAFPLFLYIVTGKMLISYETQFFIIMSEMISVITYLLLKNKRLALK